MTFTDAALLFLSPNRVKGTGLHTATGEQDAYVPASFTAAALPRLGCSAVAHGARSWCCVAQAVRVN